MATKTGEKHIRVDDIVMQEQFEKIMQYPGYKTFNKAANAALMIGLPILLERLEGQTDTHQTAEEKILDNIHSDDPELVYDSVTLQILKELIMTATINKSLLCSIFNVLDLMFDDIVVAANKFRQGSFDKTPKYLQNYENICLQKIRR